MSGTTRNGDIERLSYLVEAIPYEHENSVIRWFSLNKINFQLRMKAKRKMRCLTMKSKNSNFNQLTNVITVSLGFIISIIVCYYSPSFVNDFKIHYNLHYNLIVHGNSDYCNVKILNNDKLFNEIRKNIFNQNEAITGLQSLLNNYSESFTPIAIIGSSGIGKTLLATTILFNFPWDHNKHYFKWSVFEDDKIKIHKLLRYVNRFSNCGQNILIIDDLTLNNLETIVKFNEYAYRKSSFTNINRLILIYIFNLSRFTAMKNVSFKNDLNNFERTINSQIKTVIFRNFNKTDLDDCIENETKQLNITLRNEQINSIRDSIDVNRSGCKKVYAKVKLFI